MSRFESYSYTFILISILYSYYSYKKIEVLIVLIINFVSLWLNIYENHEINMFCVNTRTLQYSLDGCVFAFYALLAVFVFVFFFFCKYFNIYIMSLMSTLYSYSLQPVLINQCCSECLPFSFFLFSKYFKYYEFDVNIVLILIATCTYK